MYFVTEANFRQTLFLPDGVIEPGFNFISPCDSIVSTLVELDAGSDTGSSAASFKSAKFYCDDEIFGEEEIVVAGESCNRWKYASTSKFTENLDHEKSEYGTAYPGSPTDSNASDPCACERNITIHGIWQAGKGNKFSFYCPFEFKSKWKLRAVMKRGAIPMGIRRVGETSCGRMVVMASGKKWRGSGVRYVKNLVGMRKR